MKKLLLSTAAVAGLAMVATPAAAQVQLELGGYFKGYGAFVDQDEATGSETNDFDIIRNTEVHFGGETTLDNGLTVGAHIEAAVDQGVNNEGSTNDSFSVDESYVYFSGGWGRVNFGAEDGASYLLQVAAPSADSNVDGIRQYVNPVNYGLATANATLTGFNTGGLDYDNDASTDADKITYMTPVFNGFQAGVSYTPDTNNLAGGSRSVNGNNADDQLNQLGEAYEAAVRYEGQFEEVGFALGAGYTHVEREDETVVTNDDLQEWNAGLDMDWGAFGLGVVYTENNNGVDNNDENETWVVGADYTTGPYKLGVSWLNNESDASGVDVETDRFSGGVVYTYGPGMTFRGSLGYVESDVQGGADVEATYALIGTQVNF